MAFFDNFAEKAKQFGSVAAEKTKDFAAVASEKTKDFAAVASEKTKEAADNVKITAAIAAEKREIEKNYRAIGEWFVNENCCEAPAGIADVVAAVRASFEKIAELEASRPSKAEADDIVITLGCPKCGAEVSGKFCAQCGAQVVIEVIDEAVEEVAEAVEEIVEEVAEKVEEIVDSSEKRRALAKPTPFFFCSF